jgi:hypothetical protein
MNFQIHTAIDREAFAFVTNDKICHLGVLPTLVKQLLKVVTINLLFCGAETLKCGRQYPKNGGKIGSEKG